MVFSSRHEKHSNLGPPLILTHQHLKQMFALQRTLACRHSTYRFLRGRRTRRCPHSLLPYRRMPMVFYSPSAVPYSIYHLSITGSCISTCVPCLCAQCPCLTLG